MKKKESVIELVSIKVTRWIGTPQSILVHSVFFIIVFGLYLVGVNFDKILLILTTAVSLEAIYLALFIQMTVNRNTLSLEEVGDDIEDIQENVEDLEDNFDEIQEDVEGLESNISTLAENVEDISDDVGEIAGSEGTAPKSSDETLTSIQKDITTVAAHLKQLEREITSIQSALLSNKPVRK